MAASDDAWAGVYFDPLDTTATIAAGGGDAGVDAGGLAGADGLTGRTSFTSSSCPRSELADASAIGCVGGWVVSSDAEDLDCLADRLGVELIAMAQTLADRNLDRVTRYKTYTAV